MPVHTPGRGRARGSSFALWSAWIQLLPLLTEGLLQVSVKYGQVVTLPCDGTAHVPGIPEDQLHVLWKTLDQHVYEFVDGKFYPSAGFEHRAQMSQEQIRRGDFSLTLGRTTFSDEHVYECLLEADKEYLLASMELSILAHKESVTHQSGVSLSLPLPTAGPVEVLFDPGGSAQSPRVLLSSAGLPGPGYEQRVSVQDGSLTLRSLTPADQGNYTVRDLQGNTISNVTVTVDAHRDTVTLQPGASLSVPLFTGEPVEVLFDPAGAGDSTSVCSVQNSTARCVPQYRDRVSVENQELRLQDLRKSDQGNYTALLSRSRRAISIVSLTVGGGDSHFLNLWILVPVALLLLVLGAGLVVYWKRQGRCSGSAVRYSQGNIVADG
ncbi:uncharacterized protein [Lepisosteus oculatus]|uniref:uncharacterized protein n=1 Tax=Lepisosteus oculatus TaxID=7918 RepID=UPI0035F523E8